MTGYLARISARRPRIVLTVWLLAALVSGAMAVDAEVGPGPELVDILGPATTTELKLSGGAESTRAERLLEERLRGPAPATEIVIVQSDSLTVDDAEFRAKVEEVFADIAALGSDIVTPGLNYYLFPAPQLVSEDRRTTLMSFDLTGTFAETEKNVVQLLDVVQEADGKDGFRVLTVGNASVSHERNELSERDLRQGERIGIPVAMVILVALFGTIGAVFMPIGLALIGIAVALGVTALIGQAFELVFFVTLMIIMPDGKEPISVRIASGVDAVAAEDWDACAGDGNPFVSHAFLKALEDGGAVGADTGWLPQHLVVEDEGGQVSGVAPFYMRADSYGEYVFDHGWAHAYERAGGHYYPKLLSAVPFSPVPGPRLLVRPGAFAEQARAALASAMVEVAKRSGLSSVHVNFLPKGRVGLSRRVRLPQASRPAISLAQ